MGQYWYPVNLDKREFIHPHKLGTGLKLWEQLANHPGTGAALTILLASMPEARGGGDFDLEKNWHGPERKLPEHNATPGPMPEEYQAIAARTIGRWAGDRVVFIGDYAEDSDLKRKRGDPPASKIYCLCHRPEDGKAPKGAFKDISEDVAAVIEHELNGKYKGDGWREFEFADKKGA